MFTIGQVILVGFIGLMIGTFFGFMLLALCMSNNNHNDEHTIGNLTEKILTSNNILLKISLWKMIIGFAPKDENGRYYTGVDGFVSDAFVRLGIESHTVNEQMALDKIEALDKQLGEI